MLEICPSRDAAGGVLRREMATGHLFPAAFRMMMDGSALKSKDSQWPFFLKEYVRLNRSFDNAG